MSDFSSITVNKEFKLLPANETDRHFTTKDLPDNPDDSSCCIDGTIHENGLFVRYWNNQLTWNPQLNGWIELNEQFKKERYFFRFENGIIVEVIDGLNEEGWPFEKETDAFLSPDVWIALPS